MINEPVVCLDPSPMVMLAMNALHFDRLKHRLYKPISVNPSAPDETVFEALENTLMNLAALKPQTQNSQSLANKQTTPPLNSSIANTITTTTSLTSLTSPTALTSTATPTIINNRFRRISVIESWHEREKRRTTEPIYGIDHRRQFVKNRQPLPPSSFVPPNWRPFKTIRYEREIILQSPSIGSPLNYSTKSIESTDIIEPTNNNSPNTVTPTPSNSLAKLYYCVNVFYAPPPTYPPIQLFLQVGTTPDTSTSGFLHRLNFTNLVETENYLQNLRNLLLIENGNCNLKVITDISTTGTATSSSSSVVNPVLVNNTTSSTVNTGQGPGIIRKQPVTQTPQSQSQSQVPQSQSQGKVPLQARQAQGPLPTVSNPNPNPNSNPTQTQFSTSSPPQFQLTPHQILQLNQQRTSKDSLTSEIVNVNTRNANINNK